MKKGCVYLVGAGCSGADLITVRGLKLLQRCDAVVYDDLIDPALLDAYWLQKVGQILSLIMSTTT